jgi:pimeloyl-ACP methyl ester carboxylesterase
VSATPRLKPVLMLPGLLCDAALWRAQVEGLADRAAVVIPDLTLDDSVAAMAARALAAAPPRFSLAALSMGGYVAFEMLRQAPDRIERIALIATSAAPDSPERAEQRRRAMASLRYGRFAGVTSRMLPQLIAPQHLDGPVGQTVMAMAKRVGPDAFLRQQQAILTRPDSRPLLSTLTVPVTIIVGDGDILTPPAESEAIRAGIPHATLHRLPDCGHLPALEQPDIVTSLLRDWLGVD